MAAFVHMHYMPSVPPGGQGKVSDPLEQRVVSLHVGGGN